MTDLKPLKYVKGVGPNLYKRLLQLELTTVEDFLYYMPRTYDDRRRLPKISQCERDQTLTVVGRIISRQDRAINKKRSILECVIKDETATIKAVWFNQAFLKKVLTVGKRVLVQGKCDWSEYSQSLQINVSECEIFLSPKDEQKAVGLVLPVYPLTKGLFQYQFRKIAQELVANQPIEVEETVPEKIRKELSLMEIKKALKNIHFPKDRPHYINARKRLVFDELFIFQCHLAQKRYLAKKACYTDPLIGEGSLIKQYRKTLPYQLTEDQDKAVEKILEDLKKETPMNRLLQGDVGSGKTDVAILAMLKALESGKSAALMAPTEVLANQHTEKIKERLEPFGIHVVLLKGKQRKKEREEIARILQEEPKVILIGTHAVLESHVDIQNLGLIIIDEQHRFGVMQRLKLKEKGQAPHSLYMTATPIPRSFMLTCFGDLDKTIIKQMPKGRLPQKTTVRPVSHLGRILEECEERRSKNEQLFVVYPLVEESEKIDLKSATEGYQELQKRYGSEQVGLLHGKMKPAEKQEVMDQFRAKKFLILVATTVIEVGIDIPDATMMIVIQASRFGLSQLHQLRGRIGRGGGQSYCYLLSDKNSEVAKKRLEVMKQTTDGFKIAEADIAIRGPGDVLGTKQSGLPTFKLADLARDEEFLITARKKAFDLIVKDPLLKEPEHQMLAKQMATHKHLQEVKLN